MKLYPTLFFLLLISCKPQTQQQSPKTMPSSSISFDLAKASKLYHFAFDCIDQEYPNKTGHVMGDSSYLATPSEMHPAFYGCFDWHSAVHGHWTLVTLLSRFPDLPQRDEILAKLQVNITPENIQKEVEYFQDSHNRNFERTYGWAWLFKLDQALQDWDAPEAKAMHEALQPLTELLADKLMSFLDKLSYPIRVGEHPNTAFGLSFAYDYALGNHPQMAEKIRSRSRDYYLQDKGCPLTWEPSGFDFLSPCLQEASLMQKVLGSSEFELWISEFMPGLLEDPASQISIAKVSDRSDGKLAHLDGLNFSRAWCLYELGYGLKNEVLVKYADEHLKYSYELMDADEYAGSHWLASFAVYALVKGEQH